MRVASTLVAISCLAACGGSGTDGGTGVTTDVTTSVTTSATTTSSASASTGGSDDLGFPYVPWGPDDAPIPAQYAAMAAAPGSPPRCGDLAEDEPGGRFWALALDVCRAITNEGPWPTAVRVPEPPRAENEYQACLDVELGSMLENALRWHRAHPDQQPEVSYPSSSSRSPCQDRIYEVWLLDKRDLAPKQQHDPGVVPIAITFNNIGPETVVRVNGVEAECTSRYVVPGYDPYDGLGTVVACAPAGLEPQTVEVEVETAFATLTAMVDIPPTDDEPTDPPTTTDERSTSPPASDGPTPP